MPLYQARCPQCGSYAEYRRSIDERMDTPVCDCGSRMDKVIYTAPTGVVTGKFEPFVSMVDGTLIRNNRELQEHNRRNNVVNLNDGFSEEKVRAGDLGQKPATLDKSERVADIQEAIHKVSNGYKPKVEVDDE